MRPIVHFTPPSGWMNDPNGLIHHDGRHHLFYQSNPYAAEFGRMHWGHASSTDLITWTPHPIALVPDQPYDEKGCWSGIAVEVDGRVALLYSGKGDAATELPCLAWAEDDHLERFSKDPANPVIAAPPAGVTTFRDHSVVRSDGQWVQYIGGGSGEVGEVYAYASTDFTSWYQAGCLASSATLAIPGAIWECPDVFSFGLDTVLLVSIIGSDRQEPWWSVGTVDGHQFDSRAVGVLDVGDRFYAPQSYWALDGRRLMFGWLRTQLDAAAGAEWTGAMSLPREVSVRDGELWCTPARELVAARGEPTVVRSTSAGPTVLRCPDLVAVELEIDPALAAVATSIRFEDSAGAQAIVVDLTALERPGPLTIYCDAGIVEAFRGGRAGAWSQLGLERVSTVTIEHAPTDEAYDVTVWPLLPAGE